MNKRQIKKRKKFNEYKDLVLRVIDERGLLLEELENLRKNNDFENFDKLHMVILKFFNRGIAKEAYILSRRSNKEYGKHLKIFCDEMRYMREVEQLRHLITKNGRRYPEDIFHQTLENLEIANSIPLQGEIKRPYREPAFSTYALDEIDKNYFANMTPAQRFFYRPYDYENLVRLRAEGIENPYKSKDIAISGKGLSASIHIIDDWDDNL